jgi:tetratricopeptide (TPR) repeat protein
VGDTAIVNLMRWLLTGIYTLVAVLYISGAFYFYTEERSAWPPGEGGSIADEGVRHPEALLGGARNAMDSNDFSPAVRETVLRSFGELPSFYQPPFLLAAYYANRLEEPEKTHLAFEAAVNRFPTNGRLHLAYARWLFKARSIPPAGPAGFSWIQELEPEQRAERHMARALELEPNLARQGLDTLRTHRVPPDRWAALLPDEEAVHMQLLTALFNEGYREQALGLLRGMLAETTDPDILSQASNWALRWGEPALALEAAGRWLERERSQSGILSKVHEAGLALAKAHLELGETDAAYEAFRDALNEVGPSSRAGLELLCSMASEYLNKRQVVSAQSLFGEATTLAPRHVPARLGLARTYRWMGEDEEAIEEYKRVLRIEPNNAEAATELARLLMK